MAAQGVPDGIEGILLRHVHHGVAVPLGFLLEQQFDGQCADHRIGTMTHHEIFTQIHESAALRVNRQSLFDGCFQGVSESMVCGKGLRLRFGKPPSDIESIQIGQTGIGNGINLYQRGTKPFQLLQIFRIVKPERSIQNVAYPGTVARKRGFLFLKHLGLGSGYSRMSYSSDAYTELLINETQFDELLLRIALHGLINGSEETQVTALEDFADPGQSAYFLLSFFVGDRFVSENALRHSRSDIGVVARYTDAPPLDIRGDLNFWEYTGSFRYDLTTGSIRLFPKAGYGLSWYRIENVAADGDPFEDPDSEWIRKPAFFENLLPNTWHAGAGLEWIVLKNYATPPKGIDLSLRIEWTWYTNKLGLNVSDLPLETLIEIGVPAEDLPSNRSVSRSELRIGATLSF